MRLNETERKLAESQLHLEETLICKFSALSALSCDSVLSGKFARAAEIHKRHYDSLIPFLQEDERHAKSR